MVSDTRALLKYVMLEVEGGSRAAVPKGSMTYAFTHKGNFLLSIEIWDSRMKFGPSSCD